MLRILIIITAIATGITVVYAQNLDAIKQRREVMKSIATAGITNFEMIRGRAPFDLSRVQTGLMIYQSEAEKLKNLFPDDSKIGGGTDASPKIWQAKAEFEAAIETFIAIAKTAAGTIKDETTFKVEYPKVVNSCNGCHKDADGFSPRLADSFKKLNQ